MGCSMAKKTLDLNEVIDYVAQLPFKDFYKVVREYSNTQHTDFSDAMNHIVVSNFEQRLGKLEINKKCPKCGSDKVSKYGKRNNIQVFKCKECSRRFTRFSGTVLEKTRWHWDI